MYNEIMQEQTKLETALKLLKERGIEYAKCESEYKMELAKCILRLKDQEKRPATLILNLAYGDSTVNKKRLDRDIAEVLYKSALEAVNVFKLKIRVMENQYDKEWGNTK